MTTMRRGVRPPGRQGTASRRRAWVTSSRWLALLAGAVLTFPALVMPATATVDGSWVLALNAAAARGLVHGRDLTWTFGPLAPAVFPLDVGANLAWAVPLRLALHAAWWIAVALLVHRTRGVLAPIVVVAAMAWASTLETFSAPLLLGCLSWLAVAQARRRVWPAAVAAALSAVTLLVKFNLGLAAAVAVGAWAVLLVAGAPRAPRPARAATAAAVALVAAAGVTALLVAWRVAGGPLGVLPAWAADSFRLMQGFSTQLVLDGPAADIWLALAPLGLAAALVAVGAARDRSSPAARGEIAWAVIVALPLFAVFKSAFVRHDLHAVHWFVTLPGCLALGWPITRMGLPSAEPSSSPSAAAPTRREGASSPERRREAGAAGVVLAALAVAVGWLAWRQPGGVPWPAGPARVLEALRWPRTRAAVRAADEATRAAAVAAFGPGFDVPARVGGASIDGYPWDVAGVVLAGLNWTPRYVLQSYQAYDPVLDRRIGEALQGPSAPRYILYRHVAVDDAQPATVDPATWRAIWRWYEIDAHDGADTLLLKRRKRARFNILRPIGAGTARLNTPIDVPDAGGRPVLLYADLAPSLAGRLWAAAYRLVPPDVEVERLDGTRERHRVVWANLPNGILASHMPLWRHQVAPLLGRDWTPPAPTVRRLTFVADGRWWREAFAVRWAAVER